MKGTVTDNKMPSLVILLLLLNIGFVNAIERKIQFFGDVKIIDSVRCKTNPKYSYALYLPDNYSEKTKWPVIFIFDPGARGSIGLSAFVHAAEKFGFIAVCSNSSKNFLPDKELNEVINSLFTDVESRFSIDTGRTYTAGFSGGSRVAVIAALNRGYISGVIGCGAGFPYFSNINYHPSFNYIGLVGNRDMNYTEMYDLEQRLDKVGMPVELHIFDGGHTWPPSACIDEAVEWLELKSMYNGKTIIDHVFINQLFNRYESKAKALSEQGRLIESAKYYSYMIKDFPDNKAIIEIRSILDSLQATKSYSKTLKIWTKNLNWEIEIKNEFVKSLDERVRHEDLPDSIRNWWTSRKRTLKLMEESKDSTKQVMASRVIMFLNILCYETGKKCSGLRKYKAASVCYQLESIIDPENKNVHYLLARTYGLTGDSDAALRSLRSAIMKGFDNRQAVEKDSAFKMLKNEKLFRELILQLNN